MAYDESGYQAPGRAYYNRSNQHPAPPQTQAYNDEYSHGHSQDSGYYSQGGYDAGYDDGYAGQGHGQWDKHQQPPQLQRQYGGNGGYDDHQYQQQPPSRQGHPQNGSYNRSPQKVPPQQREPPRNQGYGGGAPRANMPPPDRQNTFPMAREMPRLQPSPVARSRSAQDGYGGHSNGQQQFRGQQGTYYDDRRGMGSAQAMDGGRYGQNEPIEQSMSRMNIDGGRRPGTAGGHRGPPQRQATWDVSSSASGSNQQRGHHGAQRTAQDGFISQHQQQGSWPLGEDLQPPRPGFQAPARPSTATGVRDAYSHGQPNGSHTGSFNDYSDFGGQPQQKRRSVEGYKSRLDPRYNDHDEEPGRGQESRHEQQLQSNNSYHKSAPTAAAANPYDEYSTNPYADETSDMPNFDQQSPGKMRNEHAISMHFGGLAKRQQQQQQQQQQQEAYYHDDDLDDDYYDPSHDYNDDSHQMYNQAQQANSAPDLRNNGQYNHQYGPTPNRGPPGGRGMPSGAGQGHMGRGGPQSAQAGMPPMQRVQTDASTWSDPGPRGRSPLSGTSTPAAQSGNPDALPHHPVPVRPGLMDGAPNDHPAPVRQYTNGGPVPSPGRRNPSIDSSQGEAPVTQNELEILKHKVHMNPNDHMLALRYAKRLVEASRILTPAIPDGRARQKAREKYIFEATKIIKKLVSQSYPEAIFYMADCYGQGMLGLAPDPKEAFALYQQAAKLGHATSAYRTAVCCEMGAEEGGGTRRDPLKAVQWYRRAASLGEPAGQYKLGMVLLKGLLGQQRNVGEGVNWLQRAADVADKDNPHALHELALLYANPPTDSRVIRDEKYSAQLFEKAARLGYKFSQYRLGEAFEHGLLGLPVDQRSSIAWYSKAAAQEEHQSELSLSGWYLTGAPGILEQSDTEAYLWARKAAQADLPKGMFAMGYYTEVGIGCPRSLEEAKRWYGRSAAMRYPKAQQRLEELKRGGPQAQRSRERLSRTDRRQNDENCSIM